MMFNRFRFTLSILPLIFVLACNVQSTDNKPLKGIQVSETHPSYWQYNGENVLLLGGSVEDNLFQADHLEEHLELLKAVGGNYVRNTMSSRDSGNHQPFHMNEDGKYDMNLYNEKYWERFKNFLEETSKRNIIVQIEVWATFDFYRDNWDKNPYNPANNVNYSERRSKLSTEISTHPVYTENNFFRSVPEQMALPVVLWYQQKFVDKLLSISLAYDNVLYCMDNETSVTADWGRFWSGYIKKKAAIMNKTVHTTEMWDPWELDHAFHNETFDHPEIYSFVDISQNNHITGEEHWTNGLKQKERLIQIDAVRPMNNVKIYGNDGGKHKTTRDAIESFIKNIMFGCASSRFHRPTSGQGLNENAQSVIQVIREVSDRMDFFNGIPHNDLLSERDNNEAYCRAIPGKEYMVYFTDGGEVVLTNKEGQEKKLYWIDVLNRDWNEAVKVSGNEIKLTCPSDGHWIALIQ